MLSDEKVITLNLRSRPLRLAYLVTCLEDIEIAVKLYTHTWGGLQMPCFLYMMMKIKFSSYMIL